LREGSKIPIPGNAHLPIGDLINDPRLINDPVAQPFLLALRPGPKVLCAALKPQRFDFSAAWREPNKSITDKIRQQLQVLRDLGLLEFLGSGSYRLHCASKCLICAINSSKKGGASFAPSS
jgi:hypothetical protein